VDLKEQRVQGTKTGFLNLRKDFRSTRAKTTFFWGQIQRKICSKPRCFRRSDFPPKVHDVKLYTVIPSEPGSFLGLDSWGVSISGWGSGLVGLECANAPNSYRVLCAIRGVSGDESRGVVRKLGVITPLRGVENSLK